MEDPNFIQALLGQKWFSVLSALVTLGATISAITPSKSDNKVLQIILDFFNALGINFGKAKNADAS